MHDQVRAALAAARYTGWDGLLAEQRAFLDEFWSSADIEIDGDAELQQAVRFAVFHVLQAGARAERRAIGAKGLTGDGYDGHTFWDTEIVLPAGPVPPRTAGRCRRAALAAVASCRWPWSALSSSDSRARPSPGARSAAHECSGYWPAGTAAFHINADIADAVRRHVAATGDTDFEREVGVELLVATARLWRSLGHHDTSGQFRIDGVTGPDEYTAIVDNNVYTNLMAQQNLRGAADDARPGTPGRRPASASTRRRWRAGATPRSRCGSPTTRRSACTRSARASPTTRSGTSRTRRRRSTPCS